ncbi:MAG: hypothetical protein NWE89_13510 [Candidatus Bathyarchaeota archaeon]|nr:hypothetical protein [Candidatus Bathyarchaeota archaeon]
MTRGFLVCLRRKAIRRKVFFGALDRLERGILDLSTRLLDQAKNIVLVSQLLDIVGKLEDALRSRFVKHLESYGYRRVVQVVSQAVKMGCDVARGWLMDASFAWYLTAQNLNQPMGYRTP